jgi:hypothetical protein
MTDNVEDVVVVPDVDEYDLTTEKIVCPEINNAWWPHSMPTDGFAHKR